MTYYTYYVVPAVIFCITLPMALMTTVQHLKYYARWLFGISVIVFCLILIGIFLPETKDIWSDGDTCQCVTNLYKLNPMDSQFALDLYMISTLTQIPNISAQYNLDTFLI